MPKPRVRAADARQRNLYRPLVPEWEKLLNSLHAPKDNTNTSFGTLSPTEVTALFEHARQLFEAEVEVFEQQHGAYEKLLRQFVTEGAVSDKIASVVLQVRKAPVHQMRLIDVLLDLMSAKRKQVIRDAINAAGGLFAQELLPVRPLVFFQDRPLGWAVQQQKHGRTTDKVLVLWYYEHQLKERFTTFVNTLLKLSATYTIDIVHRSFVRVSARLAAQTEEQRERLLQILLNQLREEGAVGSHAGFRLQRLLDGAPHMRTAVVTALQGQLLRLKYPTAAYYACVALGQLHLEPEDPVVPAAAHLFAAVFRHHLPRKGKKPTRVDRALAYTALAGLQRVLPFHTGLAEDRSFDEYVPAILKSAYRGRSFAIRLSALRVLALLAPFNDLTRDRFYRALYYAAKDVDGVRHSRLGRLYATTLQVAVRRDIADHRVMAMVKRILQTAHQLSADMASRLMFLSYSALSAHPALRALLAHPEEPSVYSLEVMRETELLKDESSSNDTDDEDTKDKDTFEEFENESINHEEDEEEDDEEDDDEEEDDEEDDDGIEIVEDKDEGDSSYVVQDDDGTAMDSASETESQAEEENNVVHIQQSDIMTDMKEIKEKARKPSVRYLYDSNGRDPERVHAEDTCLWEVTGLQRHYDPTIRHAAHTLARGKHNAFFGMTSPSLLDFLDRFTSRPQPKVRAVRSVTAPQAVKYHPVEQLAFTSTEFAKLSAEEVPPSARFARRFHDLHEDQGKTENLHPHLEHHMEMDESDDGLEEVFAADQDEDLELDSAALEHYDSDVSEWSYSELEHVLRRPKQSEEAAIVEDDSDIDTLQLENKDVEDNVEEPVVGKKRKKKTTKSKKNKRARRE